MGIRNLDNGRLKVKFSGLLLAAVRRMIQRYREDQIGDANETGRPDEAYQLRSSAWGMWWGKISRSFCPPHLSRLARCPAWFHSRSRTVVFFGSS